MRAVVQRVSKAFVKCESGHTDQINSGLLVLLGIESSDTTDDIEWLTGKICRLRIFNDSSGVMNLALSDIGGDIMVISQFTLHASTRKGNRPSYVRAAPPLVAVPLFSQFISRMERETGRKVRTGKFGDHMEISLINDGPVTIIIDSKNRE
jgi:D-tyrosyl-tRNA(Tyr) deacylase